MLTAAHCVADEADARDMYVRVGDHDNAAAGDAKHAETIKVASFEYHKAKFFYASIFRQPESEY